MPPLPRDVLAAKAAKRKEKEKEQEPPASLSRLTAEEAAALSEDQRSVLRALRTDMPLLTDQLAEETGLPIQRVLPALTLLEISGWAVQNGARSFVRTVELPEEE